MSEDSKHLARSGGTSIEQEAADSYVDSGAHATCLKRVADFVIASEGAWFNNADLDRVGGLEGRRRRRELGTRFGWEFEGRKLTGNTWQFRVVYIPEAFSYNDLKKKKGKQ